MTHFKNNQESGLEVNGFKPNLTFDLTDVDVSVANAIRRTIIANVPVYSIISTSFKENTSSLHDEILSARLPFVPLKFQAFENIDLSTFRFRLVKQNKTETKMNIYLSDFEVSIPSETKPEDSVDFVDSDEEREEHANFVDSDEEREEEYKEDESLDGLKIEDFVSEPNILFMFLKPGQSVNLSAKVGFGTQAKFGSHMSPVCSPAFENLSENKFRMTVESVGQRPPTEILLKAIDYLQKRLTWFRDNMFQQLGPEYTFPGEGPTVAAMIVNSLIEHPEVKFAAYRTGHPLKKILKIRIKSETDQPIRNSITDLQDLLSDIREEIAPVN